MAEQFPRYYARNGHPITMAEMILIEEEGIKNGVNPRRVAETTLPSGIWISTVHMYWDHGYGGGPPLIFETMVFDGKDTMSELDCQRYATEAEALAGHAQFVAEWREKQP